MYSYLKKILRFIGYNFFKNVIEYNKLYNPIHAFNYEQVRSSYNYFKKYFKQSLLIDNVLDIRKYSIKKSLENLGSENFNKEYFLEFGVHTGSTLNIFADIVYKYNRKVVGFDSFLGQNDDWPGYSEKKSNFKFDVKNLKLRNNASIIVGQVEDTLLPFLKKKNPKIVFAHLDLDHYPSTAFVLKSIKNYLVPGSILLFNMIHNYSGWELGTIKALEDNFQQNEYKFIFFSSKTQAAIKII
jgi:SAM-dependent methyltransferase